MGLIGNSAAIFTHNGTLFPIQQQDYIEQGFTMRLSYSQSISVNTNGRLLHRGGYLRNTFDLQLVLPLPEAETLDMEYRDYVLKQRGGNYSLFSWILQNNRMKSVGNGFSPLQFNSYTVYPESIIYNPLNNEWAEVSINLTTHNL